jgi:hypothetical protein
LLTGRNQAASIGFCIVIFFREFIVPHIDL